MATTNIQVFPGDVEVASNINASNITTTQQLTVTGNATMTQQLTVDDTLRVSDGSSDPLNFVDLSLQVVSSPVWLQEQKLTAGDISGNSDWFGWSVAIDGDGDTVILGRPRSYVGSTFGVGAAYIFTRSGTTWTQQQKLQQGDPGLRDYLGHSVSISKDGNTVAVGAYEKSTPSVQYAGAVYVFVRPPGGTTWTQQQKLTATNPQLIDYLGSSVCISGDGNTIISGGYYARRNLPATTNTGSAWVFVRSPGGTTWTQQQELVPNPPKITIAAHFGYSVSITDDGDTVLVGARYQNSAYIFTRSGTTWTQQHKFIGPHGSGDHFGSGVALSGDGNTAIIGAPYNDSAATNAGCVYFFIRSGNTWSTGLQKFASDIQADDLFGYSVSINGDGTKAIVGAYQEDTPTYNVGSAYIFNRSGSGNSWSQFGKLSPSPHYQHGWYGYTCAIAKDVDHVIVGAHKQDSIDNAVRGAAWIHQLPVYRRLAVSADIQIEGGSLLSFTGQHICFPEGPVERGLVVSANRNKFMNLNGPLSTGLSAIKSSESLPIVSLSNVRNDTNIFGVVDSVESASLLRTQRVGGNVIENKKESGDNRVIVNSLGEGAMWVVNTNGNISSGDYITTSNINGYGHKQDDDILHSYTVAKITMDCDFNPQEIPIQVIKKDNNGTNVLDNYGRLQWEDTDNTQKVYQIKYLKVDGKETDQANAVCTAAYVGCTYHCG